MDLGATECSGRTYLEGGLVLHLTAQVACIRGDRQGLWLRLYRCIIPRNIIMLTPHIDAPYYSKDATTVIVMSTCIHQSSVPFVEVHSGNTSQ